MRREELNDVYYAVGPGRSGALAWIDLAKAVLGFPKLVEQAWLDVNQRYRRSILGPFWLVMGTVALAGGFATLGTFLFKVDLAFFMLYVLAGVTLWQLISGCLSDATAMYSGDAAVLLSSRTSISGYALRAVVRQTLIFAHAFPIVLLVSALTDRFGWELLYLVPAFLLIWAALTPMTLVVGLWAARMRDVAQAVTVVLYFVVYMTPVFWLEGSIPKDSAARLVVEANPFYHLIQLVREPLLGDPPAAIHWAAAAVTAALAWAVALAVFPSARGRVVYWL